MASSAPTIKSPATFPAPLAWLQQRVRLHVRPYHLAIGAVVGLVTGIFAALIVVLLLISTNFNILAWME
jgi:hypothetical protein